MEAPLKRSCSHRHQLRVLEGKVPTNDGPRESVSLPEAPDVARLKLDVSRLMTRPDLVAARLRVSAVDEQVGAALPIDYPAFDGWEYWGGSQELATYLTNGSSVLQRL